MESFVSFRVIAEKRIQHSIALVAETKKDYKQRTTNAAENIVEACDKLIARYTALIKYLNGISITYLIEHSDCSQMLHEAYTTAVEFVIATVKEHDSDKKLITKVLTEMIETFDPSTIDMVMMCKIRVLTEYLYTYHELVDAHKQYITEFPVCTLVIPDAPVEKAEEEPVVPTHSFVDDLLAQLAQIQADAEYENDQTKLLGLNNSASIILDVLNGMDVEIPFITFDPQDQDDLPPLIEPEEEEEDEELEEDEEELEEDEEEPVADANVAKMAAVFALVKVLETMEDRDARKIIFSTINKIRAEILGE